MSQKSILPELSGDDITGLLSMINEKNVPKSSEVTEQFDNKKVFKTFSRKNDIVQNNIIIY